MNSQAKQSIYTTSDEFRSSMEVQDILKSIQPLQGQVLPIKTVQETQTAEEFDDAYIAEVNVKLASKVVKALDAAFPRDPSMPLNHLRRFAKYTQLPESLRSTIQHNETAPTIFVLVSPPLPDVNVLQKVLAPFAPPTEDAPEQTPPVSLHIIRIPTQPPLNAKQAEKWTSEHWPVVFNPAAPRATIAPPPQILHRARESIQPNAGHYLALAHRVAEEAEQSTRGRRIGAVVVDPDLQTEHEEWTEAIVAVAGDARYSRREAGTLPEPASDQYNPDEEGGPELHALLRAVDLIAQKRRGGTVTPLSPLESYFLSQSQSQSQLEADLSTTAPPPEKFQKTNTGCRIRTRAQGGYLCTDLDVYLTHEPCVCCSMGMLLSRFRAVVFPRTGRLVTGGLASEPVVVPTCDSEAEPKAESGSETESKEALPRMYYGLHWRKELNWRALGFEFVEDDGAAETEGKTLAFHA